MPVTDFIGVVQLGKSTETLRQQVVTQENLDDRYILSIPLRRGNTKIECGRGTIFDGDVRPGMLRVLAPGEQVRVTTRSPQVAATLSIAGAEFRSIVAEQGYKCTSSRLSQFEPILKPARNVERLSLCLLASSEMDANQRQLFIAGLTITLMSILFSPRNDGAGTKHAGGGELTDAQLARCLDYAGSRLAERLDLNAWAGAVGMSSSEFARRFQRKTGTAPYNWLINWRIDRAKQLLSKRDATLVEVALNVGFCSQSHFTEAFRRRVGISPGRWRTQGRLSGFR